MNGSAQLVVIERLIPAPPQVVFEAWLDREALQRFMCGGPGVRVTRAECDPRVGGEFMIVMMAPYPVRAIGPNHERRWLP